MTFCLLVVMLALAAQALARNAYVANNLASNVSVIDTQTNAVVGSPIAFSNSPVGIAITPDGTRAYVATPLGSSVSVIDTQTNAVVGSPITTHNGASWIAITPDGRRAYVVNSDNNSVSVINTQTNAVVGSAIAVGDTPREIAITPDGTRAYLAVRTTNSVYVIDTQTNTVVGPPIALGAGTNPWGIAITPDGSRAYVANNGSTTVSVIDTQTNTVVGSPITVGTNPLGIAITPDGTRAYVANNGSGSVSVINTQTNAVVGAPIVVGTNPFGIAITPDGTRAYVANHGSGSVTVINTQTNTVVGSIPVGLGPEGIAITPDQPPHAAFTDPPARGRPVRFNASASTDPDGTIARYDWAFGDGAKALNAGPTPMHAYKRPGIYRATLTLTDNEGCSTSLIFSGQTAYCNGFPVARQTQAVIEVLIRCPSSAKPSGCKFALQAVTKKRKGKRETAKTKAKLKAGRSTLVSLRPKPAFAALLASAKKVLVKETVTIKGAKRTVFRRSRLAG